MTDPVLDTPRQMTHPRTVTCAAVIAVIVATLMVFRVQVAFLAGLERDELPVTASERHVTSFVVVTLFFAALLLWGVVWTLVRRNSQLLVTMAVLGALRPWLNGASGERELFPTIATYASFAACVVIAVLLCLPPARDYSRMR